MPRRVASDENLGGARPSGSQSKRTVRRDPPAQSPEERENQLIALAVNLCEKKLRDGTAPNSMIIHYLKLGSTKEQLEKKKLVEENKLLKAKTEALASSQRSEELYANAVKAIMSYRSSNDNEDTIH